MATKKQTDVYGRFTKGWRDDVMGQRPTELHLRTAEALGLRAGSKVAFANALYLRDGGATTMQVVKAVKGPQLNAMRALIAGGLVKAVRTPADDEGHKVYALALTAKGKKLVAAAGITVADAPKADAPAKEPVAQTPATE